jgi:hypothetical protein
MDAEVGMGGACPGAIGRDVIDGTSSIDIIIIPATGTLAPISGNPPRPMPLPMPLPPENNALATASSIEPPPTTGPVVVVIVGVAVAVAVA